METLPDSQRKLLKMHLLEGLSYDEIAARTGLSPLNIRVQVSLARKKLKRT
jgi:RNA polymerase sigma-70 factor (ECF subfamily)